MVLILPIVESSEGGGNFKFQISNLRCQISGVRFQISNLIDRLGLPLKSET